jgi:hypothetical protein
MGKFVVKFMDDFPMEKDWLLEAAQQKMDGKPAGKIW